MSPPTIIPNLKARILHLASTAGYAICADDVVRGCCCTLDSARAMLSELARTGSLHRIAMGWYSLQPCEDKPLAKGRPVNPLVQLMRGERKSKAVELAEVEAWLSSKEQWPNGPTGLPPARVSFAPQRRAL